jgi:hypothetical protein
LTAKFLMKDHVPFHLVVEPQEAVQYATAFGSERVYALPFSNLGLGGIPARNWVWEHAKAAGYARHWILDDNIRQVHRSWGGKRFPCDAGPAFRAIEDFVDRYENVAVAGMNYHMFGMPSNPPFFLNVHVYSCLLILNEIEQRWRGRYNEDTDLCLQVLSRGWCTVLSNVFLVEKMRTMTMKGGNSSDLYRGDGRLMMARSLERVWPYVVDTKRRFKRPQHVVRDSWRGFATPLKKRPKKDWPPELRNAPVEYGLELTPVKPVRSPIIQGIYDEAPARLKGKR